MSKQALNRTMLSMSVLMALSATAGFSGTVHAQEKQVEEELVEKIAVLGSRRAQSSSTMETASPIDIVDSDQLMRQGSTNAIDALTAVIPSLNASREPISDAASMVRPVNLRSLAADQTLVLVNGKRRHRGAVVGEFVSGVNRGAQGVDVTPLFGAALKRVEILRDGAAAQYGSDAIAGVINYALEDDPETRMITAQYGQSYYNDGETFEVSGSYGFHLGDKGFAVASFQAKDSGATSRGIQDGEGTNSGATALDAAGFPVADPVVIWGAPEVTDDYKFFLNSGYDINDNAQVYSFANYATRDVDGSFFYRNPTSRQGVFASGSNVLFADSTGEGCPVGPLPTTSFTDAQNFVNGAGDNCFAFFSQFPGGFTPRFGGSVEDFSIALGVKGELDNGLVYDFSVVNGENNLSYEIYNTVNASLGAASPNEFYLGAQIENETVVNADFSQAVEVDAFSSDLNIAFGLQYHDESFEITPGDEASYTAGEFVSQGFSVGSNGFQGFNPDISGKFSRNSTSAYVDFEADVTDSLLLGLAVRYEDYSDFGTTTNGKVSARYFLTDDVVLRGAVSTGFRAPSVGQSNLQRAATNFNNGQLEELLVVSTTSPFATLFGGGQLGPEDANNLSLGFTTRLGDLSLTVDYFNIEIENRIAQVTRELTTEQRDLLVAGGVAEAATVSQVSFFVNDFDTETSGVDVVADYPLDWDNAMTKLTLAVNYTDTKVTNRGETVTDARAREVEDALPDFRTTFTIDHTFEPFNALIRVNYYGEVFENLFNDESLPIVTPGLFLVDAEVSYDIDENMSVAIGAKNLFDEFPDEWETEGFTGRDGGFLGAIYPLNHPAGLGGGSYYMRFTANF
ncbi:TonB-dependent receptor plug domain-containing protein [Alteromonas hispanica]|uniref:TonB-dependent receptor n=1 Tax=Alteromonas hispanica TaxID=315421 RepID=A0A6L9MTS7_9ALTE|nr:TonB-dependent receptor [Alteromonas hispanica]NDW21556.1 TonB-dependent receptor [Alteromonas hispanica]